ncbi:Predicted N-formylglutamate amidohydrolase [Rhizobium sp. RU20A]|uniref:N-formylglutamate amidohydrolase n=1 Tax=Rhizobium sp. RU20A TaxID=1907412 RepID=UPI0009556F37|nr:N-formylglutamate amidohydrolase [Rhizobium sp. RU20A]SIQ22437.1 Predicted N-formylglutamate amidohydrolase [Rhizobium sp. RU20A]
MRLLTEAEGPAVAIENAEAKADVIIVCEHASRRLPAALGTLGLDSPALESHIAWDPGALDVARFMADGLDATLIHQRFSRLAYDCNRPPQAEGAMPVASEIYDIPGNRAMSSEERQARIEEIYIPFTSGLRDLIAERREAGRTPVLVTMHSFTPVYFGRTRTVEIGILHDSDSRLADRMLMAADRPDSAYIVRRNEPYGPADGVTHTLIQHGVKNGLANVMIEVRNDLIRTESAARVVAGFLMGLLAPSLADLR